MPQARAIHSEHAAATAAVRPLQALTERTARVQNNSGAAFRVCWTSNVAQSLLGTSALHLGSERGSCSHFRQRACFLKADRAHFL